MPAAVYILMKGRIAAKLPAAVYILMKGRIAAKLPAAVYILKVGPQRKWAIRFEAVRGKRP